MPLEEDDLEALCAPLRDDEAAYPEDAGWLDLTGAGLCVLAQGEALNLALLKSLESQP